MKAVGIVPGSADMPGLASKFGNVARSQDAIDTTLCRSAIPAKELGRNRET